MVKALKKTTTRQRCGICRGVNPMEEKPCWRQQEWTCRVGSVGERRYHFIEWVVIELCSRESKNHAYGVEYLYIGNHYLMDSLFSKVISFKDCTCQHCQGIITLSAVRNCCVFCSAHSHVSCIQTCSCIRNHTAQLTYPSISLHQLLHIKV